MEGQISEDSTEDENEEAYEDEEDEERIIFTQLFIWLDNDLVPYLSSIVDHLFVETQGDKVSIFYCANWHKTFFYYV